MTKRVIMPAEYHAKAIAHISGRTNMTWYATNPNGEHFQIKSTTPKDVHTLNELMRPYAKVHEHLSDAAIVVRILPEEEGVVYYGG